MKAALYARVSTDQQAEKDLSIPAQLEELKKYALNNGLKVVAEYVDAGKSARTANRPQFQEMFAEAQKKNRSFDVILIWKFSRFARNREDSIAYKAMLKKRGVQLISINEKVDDGPMGTVMEGLIELMDEFYSVNLASDTIRGMKANAAQGFRNGGTIAVGYKAEQLLDGNNEKTKIVPDPEYAPVIKRIFAMYLEGSGVKAIASTLNDEGILTNKGKPWSVSGISYILKNETYIGNVAWNKLSNQRIWRGELQPDEQLRYENVHEAIIDQESFDKVQKIISQRGMNKSIHPRAVGGRYLLTPLVHCANCGATYQGATAKGGKYNYYSCRTKVKKGAKLCCSKAFPVSTLEALVLEAIRDIVLTDEALGNLVEQTNEQLKELHDVSGESLKLHDKQLSTENQKLSKLYEALETGKLSIDDLAPRIQKLKAGIAEIEGKRKGAQKLQETRQVLEMSEDQIRKCVENLRALLDSSSEQQKKAFIQSFIKKITVDSEEASIEYTFPLDGLMSKEDREKVLSMSVSGVDDGT